MPTSRKKIIRKGESVSQIAPEVTRCVIYVRVSSGKQVTESDGLRSQERRCSDYAEQRGYTVIKVFRDEGISGALIERPAMRLMLEFLEEQSDEVAVIIDDIKRLARDVQAHLTLKLAITSSGGRLESPGFNFQDTVESEFVEVVIAAGAQLERKQNKRQVLGRMKARLEGGYWTFHLPPGFKYQKHPLHKKIPVIDPITAPTVKEALCGFASGRFTTKVEVANFLSERGYFTNPKASYTYRLKAAGKLLQNILYAGWLEYPEWNIPARKANHEGIIDLETYNTIQDRLSTKPAMSRRTDIRPEFPLRGFISCATCNRPLTASTSKGRHGTLHPYYHCQERNCPEYGKSIKKTDLEEKFGEFLKSIKPTPQTLALSRELTFGMWERKVSNRINDLTKARKRFEAIDEEITEIGKEYRTNKSAVMRGVFEKQIEDLAKEKPPLETEINKLSKPIPDLGTAYDRVEKYLEDPFQSWNNEFLPEKRLVQSLVLTSPLPYDRKTGLGTPNLSLPFLISAQIANPNEPVVDLRGLEPLTSAMRMPRSTR